MPMMCELFNEPFDIRPDGTVHAPERAGLGFTLRADALEREMDSNFRSRERTFPFVSRSSMEPVTT
jgi:hypothetical protein